MKPRWTEEEIDFLRREWKSQTPGRVIAEKLGRPLRATYMKAHHLGLRRKSQPSQIKLNLTDTLWLKNNYPHMRTALCAMRLGISLRSCVRLARQLGLEKTPQFIKECQAFTARKARESHLKNGTYPPKGIVNENLKKGVAFRYQPGHPSTRKPKAI